MDKIAIIGLGLIGGSIAKALKASNPGFEISGFDFPEIMDSALRDGKINNKLSNYEESLHADIIFVCTPIDLSLKIFNQLADKLNPNQIITDVCSVKSPFQEIWDSKAINGYYIGGHPMTGKEMGGYKNSDPLLFENCVYIVSDSAKEYPVIARFTNIVHQLGARVTFLNSKVHDIITASVSHLPQLVSVSLINSAALKESNINFFDYAAGGFRDMTRIASSDFSIWEPIIKKNNRYIIQAIENFIFDLQQIKSDIEKDKLDQLAVKFENARKKRDEIPKNTKGFIHSLVDIYVFVKDEPGVLSTLTTALYTSGINIKDIELLKVREGTGGSFRLSFDNDEIAKKAIVVLQSAGFTIA